MKLSISFTIGFLFATSLYAGTPTQDLLGTTIQFKTSSSLELYYDGYRTSTPGLANDLTKYEISYFASVNADGKTCAIVHKDKLRRSDPDYAKKEPLFKEKIAKFKNHPRYVMQSDRPRLTLDPNRTWTVVERSRKDIEDDGRFLKLASLNANGKTDVVTLRCYQPNAESILDGRPLTSTEILAVLNKRKGLNFMKDGKPVVIASDKMPATLPAKQVKAAALAAGTAN